MEETIKLWFKEGYTDFDSSEGLNRNNPFELKRLNIIVGANNSGKSRFMRAFGSKINNTMSIYPSELFQDLVNELNESFQEISTMSLDFDGILCTEYQTVKSKINKTIEDIERNMNLARAISSGETLGNLNRNTVTREINEISHSNPSRFSSNAPYFVEKLQQLIENIDCYDFNQYKLFYIDSLRSLKKINTTNNLNEKLLTIEPIRPLSLRTSYDYCFTEDQIISGEDFFEFLTDSLLGMPQERQRIEEYQAKLSHYFFNNKIITLIPHRKDDSLHIKIGEAEQFPISQLGDGLQQVIILTYKAFLNIEPSFFFIEEPEMHLHAGYVKQLMKFLLNETDHYYMATSHSNYLLDMINEDKRIALYRVDKERVGDEENKYETVIRRCDGDRTILQTLGVSPSSVFLANCTIWIEGITDRLYFVQYLKKYLDELKVTDEEKWEDYSRFIDGYHYAFVEYQGSNLDHWDFSVESAESIDSSQNKGLSAVLVTSNALVVADSDLQGKPRFDELKEQLGDNMTITLGKETENTLPKKLLMKRFYQKCPQDAISVQGNTRKIIRKDEHASYFGDDYLTSDKGVGLYLDDVIEKMRGDGVFPNLEDDQSSFTFSDKGEQGTVKNKTDFCHAIVELMQTEDWGLTDSAIELCEAIFQHIKDNND